METNSSQALPVCRVQSADGSKEGKEPDLFGDVPVKGLTWQEKEDLGAKRGKKGEGK